MQKKKVTPMVTFAAQIPAGQEIDAIEDGGVIYLPIMNAAGLLAGDSTKALKAVPAASTATQAEAPAAPAAAPKRGRAAAPAAAATPAPAAPRGRGAAKAVPAGPAEADVLDQLNKLNGGDTTPEEAVAFLVAKGGNAANTQVAIDKYMADQSLEPDTYAAVALAIIKGEAPAEDAGSEAAGEEDGTVDPKTLKKGDEVHVYLDESIVDPAEWYPAVVSKIARNGVITFTFDDDGAEMEFDAEHMKVAPR
jgi:hypothetical protein